MSLLESFFGEVVVKPVAKLTWFGQRLVVGKENMPPGTTPPYIWDEPPPADDVADPAERGSITIITILLSLFLVGMGFLALEVSRGFGWRAELAGIADSASIAGATAIDPDVWRSTGVAKLVPGEAQNRAVEAAQTHPEWAPDMSVTASATEDQIVVVLERDMPLGFVGAVIDGAEDLHIVVQAESIPRAR